MIDTDQGSRASNGPRLFYKDICVHNKKIGML
jgi:hypothetical protein